MRKGQGGGAAAPAAPVAPAPLLQTKCLEYIFEGKDVWEFGIIQCNRICPITFKNTPRNAAILKTIEAYLMLIYADSIYPRNLDILRSHDRPIPGLFPAQ